METYAHNRLTIELHNDEVITMREIARLAHERLLSAPLVQLRGVPLQRQAGLVGPDIFRVKEMLKKLGNATGIELQDTKPDDSQEINIAEFSVSISEIP